MQLDLKALFARLNPYTKRSLETASGLCVSSSLKLKLLVINPV